MRKVERSNPLVTLAVAAMGAAVGLVVQFALSSRGHAPLSPPLSLPASLVLVAGVLLVFGLRLRRQIRKQPGAIDPFHAVRLLVTARAGQIVGALFGGFGAGLLLSLTGRSVAATAAAWVPMMLVVIAGAVLLGCAAIVEHWCRVPPGDETDEDGGLDPERGPADPAVYRDR
ncbi:DUF3180 family protein [Leucobacter sp. L43]|uniref:DUF3180 family protein n=1 Tax=Leucobacter sp. L43 TaxID=2798040 RepID=UPI001904D82D|nr:DUF3180 family protein [Leucobacter sp. L43]